MFSGIWLVLLGVLAVPSLIIAKRPDAKDMIAKLTPYQGWIGAVSCLGGVWGIISAILSIGVLSTWPIFWISWMVGSVFQAALGLILGIGTLKTFIKNPQAQAKMDETLAKLSPKQGMLGVGAIGFGIWVVVASILFNG
ncbi:MAG: hypothetical protein Q8N23_04925 [Archangium sp.]|nr:hypothetical protein [Archangium sp.]MDP3151988.1 hypothetical protein [Archangium sp.]MDP3571401.1 hypothetical protein [Archangium sp.]